MINIKDHILQRRLPQDEYDEHTGFKHLSLARKLRVVCPTGCHRHVVEMRSR
jgi:hypothetical protein